MQSSLNYTHQCQGMSTLEKSMCTAVNILSSLHVFFFPPHPRSTDVLFWQQQQQPCFLRICLHLGAQRLTRTTENNYPCKKKKNTPTPRPPAELRRQINGWLLWMLGHQFFFPGRENPQRGQLPAPPRPLRRETSDVKRSADRSLNSQSDNKIRARSLVPLRVSIDQQPPKPSKTLAAAFQWSRSASWDGKDLLELAERPQRHLSALWSFTVPFELSLSGMCNRWGCGGGGLAGGVCSQKAVLLFWRNQREKQIHWLAESFRGRCAQMLPRSLVQTGPPGPRHVHPAWWPTSAAWLTTSCRRCRASPEFTSSAAYWGERENDIKITQGLLSSSSGKRASFYPRL